MLHAQRLQSPIKTSTRAQQAVEEQFSSTLETVLTVAGVGSLCGIAIWAWILRVSPF